MDYCTGAHTITPTLALIGLHWLYRAEYSVVQITTVESSINPLAVDSAMVRRNEWAIRTKSKEEEYAKTIERRILSNWLGDGSVFWVACGTHLNKDIFDNPTTFDPSRFEHPLKPIPPYAYVPFGAGTRDVHRDRIREN
ncbi:hypothetical protein IFM89_009782 [Coptis chinensis]|uniref:Uncharacterized protein n=1 Tax=Coptis chinensis TaxID=261450 RepID=A0A835HZ89_9MAGN|nr:hypothetical protein IFM89_009782 [Coptis chinensis]